MVFQQLLLAVDYCHKMGVANRDIKLENVLLVDRRSPLRIKLTDFGCCKSDRDSITKTLCGTLGYMGAIHINAFQSLYGSRLQTTEQPVCTQHCIADLLKSGTIYFKLHGSFNYQGTQYQLTPF